MNRPAPVADWLRLAELADDPYPAFARLRAEGGVHWVPSVGRFLITSYEAVHATEIDQETFSANERGSLQIRAMGHSMLRRDDPEHAVERRIWQPPLRPGAIKNDWVAVFRRNTEQYLDELIQRREDADLIRDFAAPLAAANLRDMLGLPSASIPDLQRWSQTLIDATGNYADDPEIWARGERSYAELDEALDEALPWHRANPNDTLLGYLARSTDRMSLEAMRANLKMTIGGGLNEPRDAIGTTVAALLTHPDERALVEHDPGLWPAVFDEAVRWISPIGFYSRQTTRAVDLAGVALPGGARLGVCIGAANRDEHVWENGEEFSIRRAVHPHLAFGKGVHACLGVWAAKAAIADVALPLLFNRLKGLRLNPEIAPIRQGWVFPGYTRLAVQWDAVQWDAAASERPTTVFMPGSQSPQQTTPARIAIVGSGPAGCFVAQQVRRRLSDAAITVFDRVPTPFGLARYGVAPDHQGTKSVIAQFDRLFDSDGVEFRGNVQVGRDISLDALRAAHDAVVLATGLHGDRALGVLGDALPGVLGAGALTRSVNGHPDQEPLAPLGHTVVVVGMGNVALDIVRLLTRPAEDFTGSDIDDAVFFPLREAVRRVVVLSRSAPADASFDPAMLREIAGIDDIDHRVIGADLSAHPVGRNARLDAVRELCGDSQAPLQVIWHFGAAIERVEGESVVTGVRLCDGTSVAADNIVTAIGFAAEPWQDWSESLGAGSDRPHGVYVAGWAATGPRGTIADQRTTAAQLAAEVVGDLQRMSACPAHQAQITPLPALPTAVDWTGWRRIDAREHDTAHAGRRRAKIRDRRELLAAAADESIILPQLPASGARHVGLGPTTVLFGTESGTAEMVAAELAASLNGSTVADMAVTDPASLDPDQIYLLICSTYGDGEVPTSARPFVQALATRALPGGIRYAMFGLGDRSYRDTYSRGSELLDEALRKHGALRIGAYGRYDAGGLGSPTESALEWLNTIASELSVPAPELSVPTRN